VLTGVNVVVGKVLAQALPVPVVLFLRCALAAALLAPFALRQRPTRAVAVNLFAQAALGTVGYNLALLAGLRRTGALEAGLVLATIPAVMALGAAVFLRESLTPRHWAAAALASLGMVVLASREGGGGGSLTGDGLVFIGVCCEAAYMLLAKHSATRIGLAAGAFWMQLFSLLLVAPGALAVWPAAMPAWGILGLVVFHSLTASVFSLVLWYGGMRRAPAHLAGVFSVLLPVSAAATAVLALGERIGLALGAGFALMCISILLATWPGRRGIAVEERAELPG
jgi:drug/metabolite transporter (DMT)-like permease